ncbi:MAG: thermonuclease family protein [Cyanobacteriota bacterium]
MGPLRLLHTSVKTRGCLLGVAVLALQAAVSWPAAVVAQGAPATVLSIGDGDSLRVSTGGRVITIRLACIDAPELGQSPWVQSPWGQQARQQLQTLAPVGGAVIVRRKATDRYGRSVAEITRGGRSINQELVATGAAYVYWSYISGCDRQRYSRLESEARLQRLGVWSTPGGITRPWEFRRNRRGAGGSRASRDGAGGRRWRCSEIGSHGRAQQLLRQGHTYLDGDGDGEDCESLR